MQHVRLNITGSVATVFIERPECRGALDPVLIADLKTALGDIHQELKVRAVILTGSGSYFSSGLDLSVMRKINHLPEIDRPGQWIAWWQAWSELIETMLRFPKPLIAAVDGPAVGAGLGLALACDAMVASDQAMFQANAPSIGLIGGATAALMAFRIGASFAARWALSGEAFDADEAHRVGWCAPPVSSEQIWVAASALAEKMSVGTPQAMAATKRMINETIGEPLFSQLSIAAADGASLATTEQSYERLQ